MVKSQDKDNSVVTMSEPSKWPVFQGAMVCPFCTILFPVRGSGCTLSWDKALGSWLAWSKQECLSVVSGNFLDPPTNGYGWKEPCTKLHHDICQIIGDQIKDRVSW